MSDPLRATAAGTDAWFLQLCFHQRVALLAFTPSAYGRAQKRAYHAMRAALAANVGKPARTSCHSRPASTLRMAAVARTRAAASRDGVSGSSAAGVAVAERIHDVDMQDVEAGSTSCLPDLLLMGPFMYNTLEEHSNAAAMLHSIFEYKHLPAAHQQSEDAVQHYCNMLKSFCTALEQQASTSSDITSPSSPVPPAQNGGIWPSLTPPDLKALSAATDILSSDRITWYPKFGCALMALSSPGPSDSGVGLSVRVEEVSLHLVALDSWDLYIHSTPGSIDHTSAPSSHKTMFCGSIPTELYNKFQLKVASLIQSRQEAKKGKHDKGAGFAHTPGFMIAVVKDAVRSVKAAGPEETASPEVQQMKSMTPPKGGFTDVGRHTGSMPRDTSWHLAKETLLALLLTADACSDSNDPLLLSQQTLVHLELWLLLGLLPHITPNTASSTLVNMAMVMLQSVATAAAQLAADKHEVLMLQAVVQGIRQQLVAVVRQRQLDTSQKFMLPASETAGSLLGTWAPPRGILPAELPVSSSAEGLDAARQRAAKNLGSLPVVAADQSLSAVLSQLLLRLQDAAANSNDDVKMQHALRSVEVELFSRAVSGISGQQEYAALTDAVVDQLWQVVDAYRVCLASFKASAAGKAPLLVELRSREVLVVWIAYCITFEVSRQHIVVGRYGVALQPEDLRHLCLSDRAAVDAALAVGSYLQQHTVPGMCVFSLTDTGTATFGMAEQYARRDSRMYSIWSQEQSAAQERMRAHWQQVREQQQKARDLRYTLQRLEGNERSHQSSLNASRWQSSDYHHYQNLISSVRGKISTTRSELASAEKPPQPVIQPLPEDPGRALQWLFFLYMPPLLRHMSRGSFLAQQLLLPLPLNAYPEVVKQVVVSNYKASLTEYYNAANSNSTWCKVSHPGRTGTEGAVGLWSAFEAPRADSVGPTHIDSFYSNRDGVYFPDQLVPGMTWRGSGCSADSSAGISSLQFFDPFRPIDEALAMHSFTEKLQQKDSSLQWAMPQLYSRNSTPANRGNLGIAQQDLESKPDWLSKLAYLKLTALRSYPLRQLHRLCDLLSECKDMPFDQPGVQAVIRQTLYHLGPLADSGNSSASRQLGQQWRTGWDIPGGVLEALCFELQKLADELAEKPRAHDAVLLLGEIAAYLSDWHPPCKAVARQFAAMTSKQADNQLQEEVDKAARSAAEVAHAQMLARQCKARMLALLCYAAGPLDARDVSHMIKLMVQIKHGDVYLGQLAELQQESAGLRVLCHNTMCRRLRDMCSLIQPSQLTAAVCSVLQTVPSNLAWAAVPASSYSTASYHAVGRDEAGRQHLYSVNILDGTVLLDGFPPGRLPREITSHPLFIRTFGTVDFEVFKTDQGVLVTNRSVNGCIYEFYLAAATGAGPSGQTEGLVITEVDRQSGQRLQLLDVYEGDGCGLWGQQLPVRLRQLHSHWLSRQHKIIVLRPHAFQQHTTQFIIKHSRGRPGDSPSSYACWRVPYHLQDRHWLELINNHRHILAEQRLVLEQQLSHVLAVLSRFESQTYIHVYQSTGQHTTGSAGTSSRVLMVFDMPRFGLEFELHSDSILASRDFKGYCLDECQQLAEYTADGFVSYTLPDFQQYLVLRRCQRLTAGAVPGSGRADMLVLVPSGLVQPGWAGAGKVAVAVDESCGAKLQYQTFEVHGRFGYLQASSIHSRLQLAALYAATSSLLPEPASQQTGAETAMQLVRHSWSNQPLSAEEMQQLHSISNLGGHLAPALRLLTYDLEASSSQLQHLHVHNTATASSTGSSSVLSVPELDTDAAADYQQLESRPLPGAWGLSSRQLLTPLEEQHILHSGSRGINQSVQTPPRWLRDHGTTLLDVPPCPVSGVYTSKAESELAGLVVLPQPNAVAPAYPLSCSAGDGVPLRHEMHRELQASWEAHHTCPEATDIVPGAHDKILKLQADVVHRRRLTEGYLMQHLLKIFDQDTPAGSCFSLLRSSCLSPSPGLRDLLRCAFQPGLTKEFNPFLSEKAHATLQQAILIWAQLCVLEDRLSRLVQLFALDHETYRPVIIRELLVERIWDPCEHPKWLVFEVEGQLQIRPDQYHHARELLSHPHDSSEPGPITQLNMGEGKTRVILPMLAMEWADGACVVRLNFLSPLLAMSYQHLHNTLTASVISQKLFTMPFHRDVEVTHAGARAMLGALTYCHQVGGLLLVAPEHRLSLLLKSMEIWGKGDHQLHDQLQQLMALRYQDILDESDELLHHRLQLVYACGTPQGLPALQERTVAIQALLRLISDLVDAGKSPEFAAGGVAAWTPGHYRPPGSWCGLQLLPGAALEAVISDLHTHLAGALMKDQPYEMRWLKNLGRAQAEFLSCVTDPATSAESLLQQVGAVQQSLLSIVTQGQQDQVDQVLALRGLLGCNLLQHTLQKRHRVDYGVSRLQTARKRLAVPFRAADTPSPRSEFAQPDVALLLTHLSYYSDGLSLTEFKAALDQLLLMGPSAQEDHYNQWLQLSATRIAADHKPVFDDVRKVDPSNSQQLQLMHSYFSHNMAVVNFWLYYCVLSKETGQYPKRLVATSWNLADNVDGRVVGFSGTNDNHRLLPLQVQQKQLLDQRHLVGTNGKMLAMLINKAAYKTLQRPSVTQQGAFKPVWQVLLDDCLKTNNSRGQKGVEALLDCGALLAGVQIRDAAEYILQHMPSGRYKGVCYYDPSSKQWTVRDTVGRSTPLHQSPIAEAECFVVYDDARCRGADLKLKQQAVGVLTLAPGMCKDKMMQAAGRLRQLGRGQTLVVTGLPDVTDKICAAAVAAGTGSTRATKPSMQHVLQWVMDNTVQDTLHGVVEHATQGMLFAVTKNAPNRAMLDEKLLLIELYGSSKAPEPVARVLQATASKARLQLQQARNGSNSSNAGNACTNSSKTVGQLRPREYSARLEIIQRVLQTGTAHGEGHLVVAGQGADEECERELEQEEEEEKEEEKEIPRVTAAEEVDWQYDTAFAASSVNDLTRAHPASTSTSSGFHVLPLPAATQLLGSAMAAFHWSPKVYCTSNFVRAICQQAAAGVLHGLGPYQRYVDAMLVFTSGDVLLLSEREAEALQELVWGLAGAVHQTCKQPPLLLSLCYARQALAAPCKVTLLLGSPLRAPRLRAGSSWPFAGSQPTQSPLHQSAWLQEKLGRQELVSIRLFNGAASYDDEQQKQLLHQLVRGKREQAKELLALRDLLTLFAHSDLERACDVVVSAW